LVAVAGSLIDNFHNRCRLNRPGKERSGIEKESAAGHFCMHQQCENCLLFSGRFFFPDNISCIIDEVKLFPFVLDSDEIIFFIRV